MLECMLKSRALGGVCFGVGILVRPWFVCLHCILWVCVVVVDSWARSWFQPCVVVIVACLLSDSLVSLVGSFFNFPAYIVVVSCGLRRGFCVRGSFCRG